jgi:hypothetical protein
MSGADGNIQTDTYVLSMTIDVNKKRVVSKGEIYIATFIDGKWVNAVDEIFSENISLANISPDTALEPMDMTSKAKQHGQFLITMLILLLPWKDNSC